MSVYLSMQLMTYDRKFDGNFDRTENKREEREVDHL